MSLADEDYNNGDKALAFARQHNVPHYTYAASFNMYEAMTMLAMENPAWYHELRVENAKVLQDILKVLTMAFTLGHVYGKLGMTTHVIEEEGWDLYYAPEERIIVKNMSFQDAVDKIYEDPKNVFACREGSKIIISWDNILQCPGLGAMDNGSDEPRS